MLIDVNGTRLCSTSRLVVLAGAGHFPWLDDPDRYWPTVIEFIASSRPIGGGG
jgi:pimeloyl-ACP methyl ester carboxylesterase